MHGPSSQLKCKVYAFHALLLLLLTAGLVQSLPIQKYSPIDMLIHEFQTLPNCWNISQLKLTLLSALVFLTCI